MLGIEPRRHGKAEFVPVNLARSSSAPNSSNSLVTPGTDNSAHGSSGCFCQFPSGVLPAPSSSISSSKCMDTDRKLRATLREG